LHKVHEFLTMAGSLGGGGVVVGGGAGDSGGVAGSDAVSAPKKMLPSSCGMAPICSASAPFCLLVGSTGCGRFCVRLAGRVGGDGLITAPALLAVAVTTTSFLAAARAPRCCLGCGCRQRHHCGLAIGGRNCCLGAGAALEAAVAPFLEAAVAAVAIAAAAAAVGAAAAVAPISARAGPLMALARFLLLGPSGPSSLSRLRALVRRLASCWSAVRRLPWAPGRDGMGVSEMSFGGWQEKSKRSRPARVSNTTLSQPCAATHARYCSSMREAAGSRRGEAMVAVADPRQVLALLLSPLSTPYGGGGVLAGWRAGRLASCPFISTLHTGGGVGGGGGRSTAR
jgi:hypothetical protein